MINLDNVLLVPRKPVKFKVVDGTVERVGSSEVALPPLIITEKDSYDFEGFSSTYRSGIIKIEGIFYKVKGCNIESAFNTKGVYRLGRLGLVSRQSSEPDGGLLASEARNELRWQNVFNEILKREGFPIVAIPCSLVHYPVKFKGDRRHHGAYYDKVQDSITDRVFNIGILEQELVASVSEIKGDTRLIELYAQHVCDINAAKEVTYSFGLMAGVQKKLTEKTFFWNWENVHQGNYIVFTKDGKIYLAMTDFDGASQYTESRNQFGRFHPFFPFRTIKSREQKEILYSFYYKILKPEFKRGFMEGYKNLDRRLDVPLELLLKSFDLKNTTPSYV